MVFTSYLDKSYFVGRKGEYVANIQVMSRDKLEQVRGQFLSREKLQLSCHNGGYVILITAKQVNAPTDVFLVCRLPVTYCDMLHHFFCIRQEYYKTFIPWKLCPFTF